MNGKRDEGSFSPGGRFSLGRMERGSGYCVGIVVEGRFGNMDGQRGTVDNGGVEGNGMEDMWIFGEPFFRDVQVAFDVSFLSACFSYPFDTDILCIVEREASWHATALSLALTLKCYSILVRF